MKRDLFRAKLLAHLKSMDESFKQIANDVNLLLRRRYESDEPLAWERKKKKP
jgi:hypothetical protein